LPIETRPNEPAIFRCRSLKPYDAWQRALRNVLRWRDSWRTQQNRAVLRHHGFANEQRFGSVAQVMWDAPLDYPILLR
jgi:P2-related tail formation protein